MNLDLILENEIRYALMKQAIALCFSYYFIGEFTAEEASRELDHYRKQVLNWNFDKELPGWAKDND